MAHRFPTAPPKPTQLPGIAYQYLEPAGDEPGRHELRCRCKRWDLTTTSAATAKRGAQTHIYEHLANAIYDPDPGDIEP